MRLLPEDKTGDLKEPEDSEPLAFAEPLVFAEALGAFVAFDDFDFGADFDGADFDGADLFFNMSSDTTTNRDFRLPCSLGLIRFKRSSISGLVKFEGRLDTASMKLKVCVLGDLSVDEDGGVSLSRGRGS